MTRFGPLGILGRPLSALVENWWSDSALARMMIPISWVANLPRMSRTPALTRLCATDPLGGGARVPIGFLTSYVAYHHTAPEQMATPVTLVHPSHDDWTPVDLSVRMLRRVAAPTSMVLLRGCGHFPVEEPGLDDLLGAVDAVVADLAG